MKKRTIIAFAIISILLIGIVGCASPPELIGYPVNTPSYYTEDKMYYLKQTAENREHKIDKVGLIHVHEVRLEERAADVIRHHDPIAVILQGVRLPEDLEGRRDIAVILDINTSAQEGIQPMVAFYQRDVPGGQMLNFSNLLVYADPEWDSSSPPYFRVRVLDVKTERNQRTEALLQNANKLTGEISGLLPHPIIPIVQKSIIAAGLILSSRRNVVLMDFQVQLYSAEQVGQSGDATLGQLLKGQWLIIGRQRDKGAEFWENSLYLNRKTNQIIEKNSGQALATKDKPQAGITSGNVPVPYVSVVIMKANVQVPKLVMDRSASLIQLLSSPTGKTDIDAMDDAADVLASSIRAYTAERRLTKYRSKLDLQAIINLFEDHATVISDGKSEGMLNKHEIRRLINVFNKATGRDDTLIQEIVGWWNDVGSTGSFQIDPAAPLGVIWKLETG